MKRYVILIAMLMGIARVASYKSQGSQSHTGKNQQYRQPKDDPSKSVIQDNQLLQDKEHLKEDLPAYLTEDDIDNMSPKELEYYFFKQHDFDDNGSLDGLELLAALFHIVEHDGYDEQAGPLDKVEPHNEAHAESLKNYKQIRWQKLIESTGEKIDRILIDHDTNKDGFLSYPEYVVARSNQLSF